jgi:imidazolonepropionase-like amidohydrolase
MMRATCLLVSLAAAAIPAQDLTVKAPPQRRPLAILGATLHIGDGRVLDPGVIWFDEGRIAGLGTDEAAAGVPPGAERVDAAGREVWPGMISAVTRVGLNEIGSVPATQDYREIGDFAPEVCAAIAINPDATTIPVTRSNGVLTVGVFPSGAAIPGRASVVELAGWTAEDMTVRADAGGIVEWPATPVRVAGATRRRDGEDRSAEQRRRIEAFFADARAWRAAQAADPTVPTDIRYAALAAVLDAERPLFIVADDLESIRSSIRWALEAGLRPVLVGGREADLCTDFLREHEIPVVVLGTHRLPGRRDDAHDRPFRLPAVLHAAGVRFCIAGDGGYENERNLPYHAAKAVAHGLPLAAAERAVGAEAARILGLGEELGTLEPGKRATLVVTDGHPLEIRTRVHAAWVSGRRIDLGNKQTALARKYEQKYRQLGLWPPDGR